MTKKAPTLLLLLCVCLPAQPVLAQVAPPELPRVYLDTAYPQATGIRIIVGANESLQNALDVSHPGDDIQITAGVEKAGNYLLPQKAGAGVILIRSSNMAGIPAEGERVDPSVHSAAMPKLVTPNSDPVVRASAGAHGYRFVGIEFKSTVDATTLIAFGDGSETSSDQLASNLTIDRCYLHGQPDKKLRRGVALNSAATAIIDSYISDVHEEGADSQAICGWNGPGPFKIVDNYLEAAGENVMFGGADPKIAGLIPSDIEIRRNHFKKLVAWRDSLPHWSVKNLFELKNAARVLVEGNLFENCWVDAQTGYAILIKSVNQDGAAPWCRSEDITFRYNEVRGASGAVNIRGFDPEQPGQVARRIKIESNFFFDIGGTWGGAGGFLQISDARDVSIDHNTVIHTGNVITAYGPPSVGFAFTNNISRHNLYGVKGDNCATGLSTLSTYFQGYSFLRNILAGGQSSLYPDGNFFPASLDDVGFMNVAKGAYWLNRWSKYRHAGTDGQDVGADFGAIEWAMSAH